MTRSLCIIHANCQGDTLQELLLSTPSFASKYKIIKYTNYLQEHIPQESFDSCSLLLYQYLADHWGPHATTALLQKVPLGAQALRIPNMFFNGYWPLWTNATRMAYGDMLLEYLAGQGFSQEEILHVYLKGNLISKYDIGANMRLSRQQEEVKEVGLVVESMDIIEEYWRKEQLFHTVNHPGARLLLHVADGVLRALDLGRVPEEARKALMARQEEFEQPIHPQIAKHLGLPFAPADRRYHVYGQELTFAQYAAAYTACRMQHGPEIIEDFVVYLHLLAQQSGRACAHG